MWRLWLAVRRRLRAHVWAWCVTASAVLLSLGLPALGVACWALARRQSWPVATTGWPAAPVNLLLSLVLVALFCGLSVWAWQVAGYAFTVALYGSGTDGPPPSPGAGPDVQPGWSGRSGAEPVTWARGPGPEHKPPISVIIRADPAASPPPQRFSLAN